MELTLLSSMPFVSAFIWVAIGLSQARGGTAKVSTGMAFVATSFLLATFALWDGLNLLEALPATAAALPPSSLYLAWASLTFLYFAKWLIRGRWWGDLIVALPAVLATLPFVLSWSPALEMYWLDTDLLPVLAEVALRYYVVYSIFLIVAGIQFLRLGALLAFDVMGRESWALLGIIGAASLMLAFAVLTNPYYPLLQPDVPSVYSTTLVAPGILLLAALRRGRGIGLLRLFNLEKSFQGETLAIYLTYKTGDLLGAALAEARAVDDDVFVGTFDAFQSFFRHALPFLRDHPLKIANFGEIAVIIERGDHCYLTVVTTSKRLGLIRELMRGRLRKFEGDNMAALTDWSGLLDILQGTDQVLQGFVGEEIKTPPAST